MTPVQTGDNLQHCVMVTLRKHGPFGLVVTYCGILKLQGTELNGRGGVDEWILYYVVTGKS